MIYVRRDEQNRIVSVSRQADGDHGEMVEGDSPEVRAFLNDLAGEPEELVQSDIALVRVLEDVIDLLIDQDVIRFTDLPVAAQGKLLHRRSIRDAFRSLNLINDDENEVI